MDTAKIANALRKSEAKIVMFADGFVDEVWEIISSRASISDYSTYAKMSDFAKRVWDSGTGGVGLELIRKRRAFGGFTANIGYAAARLGVSVSMVGVYGKDKLDPVFDEVGGICNVISLSDPAVTYVFEFDDGKILMSHMESVQDISWRQIVDGVGIGRLVPLLAQSALVGIGYWSLLPAFDEILMGTADILRKNGGNQRFFFDFADFRKRDELSLKESLAKVRELNKHLPMILSVNEHEACALFSAYGETFDGDIAAKADKVREAIGLTELVIHEPSFAVSAAEGFLPAFVKCEVCKKPKRTAGAGDSFNGGYVAATLAGLEPSERLHVANEAVAYFIRNAAFPGISDLFYHEGQ